MARVANLCRLAAFWTAALVGLAAGRSAMAVLVDMTDIVAVEAGASTACALDSAGGVRCWGKNYTGQLGDGTHTPRYFAGYVSGLSTGVVATAISKGSDRFQGQSNVSPHARGHACALLVSGGIKCWGFNGSGQLGDGTTIERPTPVDVVGLGGPAVAIVAGVDHTCALLGTGAVQCWGDNSSGQLGDNTTASHLTPTDVVGLGGGIVQIAAAGLSTCALTSSGGVKCWGANGMGQLGDGTQTMRPAPVDVSSLSSGVQSMTVGGTGSSAFACAVMVSGLAKCWGGNWRGQLGDGSFNHHLTPVDVLLPGGIARISAGGTPAGTVNGLSHVYIPVAHACAMTTGGAVKCWGENRCGQLGLGFEGTAAVSGDGCRAPIFLELGWISGFPSPQDVLPGGVTDLASGGQFTCALTASASVRCWGDPYALAHQTISTGSQPQTIVILSAPTNVPVGGTGTVSARSSTDAELPVAFTSASPGICSVSATTLVKPQLDLPATISNATVSGLAAGICTLTADQPGTANYEPAPQVTIDFPVGAPVGQTITFGPAPTVVLYGTGTVSATASSGLAVNFGSNTPSVCSVSGGVVTGLSIGSCTIRANQAGDRLYGPAPETTQTFAIGPNSGTVSLAVSKLGPGTGTVKADSPLIDCGAVCSADFALGAQVVLTATAASNSIFAGWSGSTCSGTGPCTVTMNASTTIVANFTSAIPRLFNISTLAQVLTGADVMIGGFVIAGATSKRVAIVATGPSLTAYGITNPLANPTLRLVRSSDQATIATNDDWQTAANQADLTAAGFAPSNPLEAAILADLAPGAYTAIVEGAGGGTGVSVIGVYEVDHPETPLINIATRSRVLTGIDVMIGGFVINGNGPQTVAIVVTGPSLGAYGIASPLANPKITLVRSSDQAVIDTNDDWEAHANASQLSTAGFAPTHPQEAAILVTLPPGAYTAIVEGVGGGTGVAVIGVYKVN